MRVIIPAAGVGSRLHTTEHNVPKVMQRVCGKPLLAHVLEIVDFIDASDTYIVVGYKKDQIIEFFGDGYHYIEQKEQLGTGHAVMMCAEAFKDYNGSVLVTFGDMPLFRRDAMQAMCAAHEASGADCTLMTAENPELTLWARVVRDDEGKFAAIVEGKDCTPEQAQIKELFSGVLVFNSASLFVVIPYLTQNNVQHEYYLTEVLEIMARNNMRIETFLIEDGHDLCGVNTLEDLRRTEAEMVKRRREA